MVQVGRRRHRWPLVILGLIVVVVAALIALDFAARYATQDAVASNVKRSTHASSASVNISSFPFIYDVAAEGRLDRIDITARDVQAGAVTLSQVRLDASQVRLDRNELLDHRTVRITAVGSATLTAVVDLSPLANALATDLGLSVTSTSSGRISIQAAGHTVATVNLTTVPLIPSCPLDVQHTGTSYTVSCTVSPVPPSVISALSAATH